MISSLLPRACPKSTAFGTGSTYAVQPSANSARQRRFLDLMALQGFEVYTAEQAFVAQGTDRLGREIKDLKLPAGTWLIPTRQPLAHFKAKEEELKRRDSWRAIFMPAGALLAGRVDDRSWLTAGCADYVPLIYSGKIVLVAPPSVQVPVRLGVFNPAPLKKPPEAAPAPSAESKAKKKDDAKPAPGWTIAPPGFEMRLRMSGLLWPEAADRLANAAYLTRESVGSGQLILCASDPTFRGAALGTSRIFANAIVFGPGMGASEPIKP